MSQTMTISSTSATETFKSSKVDVVAAFDVVANGPVAQNIMDESAKTSEEMSKLAASRHTPDYTAATGQPLTHYHSFFSELLSWRNPRASAIAYASTVSLIFAVRYLDLLRWTFKITWLALFATVTAEAAGKVLFNSGFVTQLRPRRYYTVPKETLNTVVGDVHELINFFVIEAQRILFAENVWASAGVALAALISYYLVKIVPYWGLALIATTVTFFAPLIYTTNQELIDAQLKHASEIVNAQTAQLRVVAQRHTEQAAQVAKQYVGDYTSKAQDLLKGARHHEQKPASGIKADDFPAAPKADIKPEPEFPEVPKDEIKPVVEEVEKTESDPLLS